MAVEVWIRSKILGYFQVYEVSFFKKKCLHITQLKEQLCKCRKSRGVKAEALYAAAIGWMLMVKQKPQRMSDDSMTMFLLNAFAHKRRLQVIFYLKDVW